MPDARTCSRRDFPSASSEEVVDDAVDFSFSCLTAEAALRLALLPEKLIFGAALPAGATDVAAAALAALASAAAADAAAAAFLAAFCSAATRTGSSKGWYQRRYDEKEMGVLAQNAWYPV